MKETSTDEQTKRNEKRRESIQQAISKQASALKNLTTHNDQNCYADAEQLVLALNL